MSPNQRKRTDIGNKSIPSVTKRSILRDAFSRIEKRYPAVIRSLLMLIQQHPVPPGNLSVILRIVPDVQYLFKVWNKYRLAPLTAYDPFPGMVRQLTRRTLQHSYPFLPWSFEYSVGTLSLSWEQGAGQPAPMVWRPSKRPRTLDAPSLSALQRFRSRGCRQNKIRPTPSVLRAQTHSHDWHNSVPLPEGIRADHQSSEYPTNDGHSVFRAINR